MLIPALILFASAASLPDPDRLDFTIWESAVAERAIAADLNASLDLWRLCGWTGQEEPAAVFVTWSRTHWDTLEANPERTRLAMDALGEISAYRLQQFVTAKERMFHCEALQPRRVQLKQEMDRQVDALIRAHRLKHRD